MASMNLLNSQDHVTILCMRVLKALGMYSAISAEKFASFWLLLSKETNTLVGICNTVPNLVVHPRAIRTALEIMDCNEKRPPSIANTLTNDHRLAKLPLRYSDAVPVFSDTDFKAIGDLWWMDLLENTRNSPGSSGPPLPSTSGKKRNFGSPPTNSSPRGHAQLQLADSLSVHSRDMSAPASPKQTGLPSYGSPSPGSLLGKSATPPSHLAESQPSTARVDSPNSAIPSTPSRPIRSASTTTSTKGLVTQALVNNADGSLLPESLVTYNPHVVATSVTAASPAQISSPQAPGVEATDVVHLSSESDAEPLITGKGTAQFPALQNRSSDVRNHKAKSGKLHTIEARVKKGAETLQDASKLHPGNRKAATSPPHYYAGSKKRKVISPPPFTKTKGKGKTVAAKRPRRGTVSEPEQVDWNLVERLTIERLGDVDADTVPFTRPVSCDHCSNPKRKHVCFWYLDDQDPKAFGKCLRCKIKKVWCDLAPPISRHASTNPREVRAMQLFFLAYHERLEAGLYRPRNVSDALLMLSGKHNKQDTTEDRPSSELEGDDEYTDGESTLEWWRNERRPKGMHTVKGRSEDYEDDETGEYDDGQADDEEQMDVDSDVKSAPHDLKKVQPSSGSESDSSEEALSKTHSSAMHMMPSASGSRSASIRISQNIGTRTAMMNGLKSKREKLQPVAMPTVHLASLKSFLELRPTWSRNLTFRELEDLVPQSNCTEDEDGDVEDNTHHGLSTSITPSRISPQAQTIVAQDDLLRGETHSNTFTPTARVRRAKAYIREPLPVPGQSSESEGPLRASPSLDPDLSLMETASTDTESKAAELPLFDSPQITAAVALLAMNTSPLVPDNLKPLQQPQYEQLDPKETETKNDSRNSESSADTDIHLTSSSLPAATPPDTDVTISTQNTVENYSPLPSFSPLSQSFMSTVVSVPDSSPTHIPSSNIFGSDLGGSESLTNAQNMPDQAHLAAQNHSMGAPFFPLQTAFPIDFFHSGMDFDSAVASLLLPSPENPPQNEVAAASSGPHTTLSVEQRMYQLCFPNSFNTSMPITANSAHDKMNAALPPNPPVVPSPPSTQGSFRQHCRGSRTFVKAGVQSDSPTYTQEGLQTDVSLM
ncbi:hypothetical protein BDW22DRAFT_1475665 [Trametopsis cervina]|nr:hypothetical protein BDW22DRAFT_1475665 [Trametopsis cervina]